MVVPPCGAGAVDRVRLCIRPGHGPGHASCPYANHRANPRPKPDASAPWTRSHHLGPPLLCAGTNHPHRKRRPDRRDQLFWYELARDGSIKGAVQSQYGMEMARSAGVRIVPSILNGGFDRARVAEIIHDPARRAQHIDAILALVMENDFDGIDIDYESLYPEDRDNFSLFIEELAAALHAEDKLLSMAVHAKTAEPGNWGGPQAQDWVRLGAAVDEFKIMVYDYHNGASEAGPIAPLAWADAVLTFAATQLPPEKTYLGVPVYGYRWTGSRGESLIWRQVNKLIEQSAPILQRDENGEAWFTLDTGQTVYYHDAESMRVRLQTLLTAHPDLAGISIWSLGGEDPAIWPTIRQEMH